MRRRRRPVGPVTRPLPALPEGRRPPLPLHQQQREEGEEETTSLQAPAPPKSRRRWEPEQGNGLAPSTASQSLRGRRLLLLPQHQQREVEKEKEQTASPQAPVPCKPRRGRPYALPAGRHTKRTPPPPPPQQQQQQQERGEEGKTRWQPPTRTRSPQRPAAAPGSRGLQAQRPGVGGSWSWRRRCSRCPCRRRCRHRRQAQSEAGRLQGIRRGLPWTRTGRRTPAAPPGLPG
jgi:hypothetical protein